MGQGAAQQNDKEKVLDVDTWGITSLTPGPGCGLFGWPPVPMGLGIPFAFHEPPISPNPVLRS